jgi:integrase
MAFLINRDSKWYIRDKIGKRDIRVSCKTSNKNKAKDRLREYEDAKERGLNPSGTFPTSEIVQAYIDHIKTHSAPGTVAGDVPLLRDIFGEICDGLKLTSTNGWSLQTRKARKAALTANANDARYRTLDITAFNKLTTPIISDWLHAHVKARNLSPRSVNRRRLLLSGLCSFAQAQRGVPWPRGINPVKGVARFKEAPPKIKFMYLDEIDTQLEHLKTDQQLQAMVAVYIFAGLRREELLWLTAADVDLDKRLIHVRAKTVNGKSWKTKTKKDRSVRINNTLLKFLQDYTRRPSFGDWMFPSPAGVFWSKDNFTKTLRYFNHTYRDAEKRHRPLKWNCKIYRHTFASQLASNGASLFEIAKFMGNSHDVCERYYAELIQKADRDVIEFGSDAQPVKAETPVLQITGQSA